MDNWLAGLNAALKQLGITIPERLNKDELRRFHDVSNGDFAYFVSSVMTTIQWRSKYPFLSQEKLESWGKLVFWHGSDVMQRPSLVIRIGHAASTLDSLGQEEFVRAVVSQVEHGVVNLVDPENPQLTVLLDCHELSPFEFPLQTFRSCVSLLQYHYPNRLGCLLVVRVPSDAQVMTQTLYEELRHGTRQKVTFVGNDYQQCLKKYFKKLPDFPLSQGEEAFCIVIFVFFVFILVLIFH